MPRLTDRAIHLEFSTVSSTEMLERNITEVLGLNGSLTLTTLFALVNISSDQKGLLRTVVSRMKRSNTLVEIDHRIMLRHRRTFFESSQIVSRYTFKIFLDSPHATFTFTEVFDELHLRCARISQENVLRELKMLYTSHKIEASALGFTLHSSLQAGASQSGSGASQSGSGAGSPGSNVSGASHDGSPGSNVSGVSHSGSPGSNVHSGSGSPGSNVSGGSRGRGGGGSESTTKNIYYKENLSSGEHVSFSESSSSSSSREDDTGDSSSSSSSSSSSGSRPPVKRRGKKSSKDAEKSDVKGKDDYDKIKSSRAKMQKMRSPLPLMEGRVSKKRDKRKESPQSPKRRPQDTRNLGDGTSNLNVRIRGPRTPSPITTSRKQCQWAQSSSTDSRSADVQRNRGKRHKKKRDGSKSYKRKSDRGPSPPPLSSPNRTALVPSVSSKKSKQRDESGGKSRHRGREPSPLLVSRNSTSNPASVKLLGNSKRYITDEKISDKHRVDDRCKFYSRKDADDMLQMSKRTDSRDRNGKRNRMSPRKDNRRGSLSPLKDRYDSEIISGVKKVYAQTIHKEDKSDRRRQASDSPIRGDHRKLASEVDKKWDVRKLSPRKLESRNQYRVADQHYDKRAEQKGKRVLSPEPKKGRDDRNRDYNQKDRNADYETGSWSGDHVSLDILCTTVHSSYPLSESIITQAFPAAIHCIMNSDDNTILQNGGECLRSYVSVALEQISAWHDESGQSGLDYIINVVQRVLDPKTSESAAAFVGRLISLLIIKAGNIIGDKSKLLLRAVLSKIQIVDALSVNQSLIMVFAHLVNHQIEPVIDFLSGVPGPTGHSALEFILDIWCQCHGLFYGAYEKKVSAFALSLILQYGLKENGQRLQSIKVRGDQIFNHTDGPKTRSKSLQRLADDDIYEDDPDICNDPVFSVNLKV